MACSMRGGDEECLQGSGGKVRKRRPLGSSRRRWEDNIKIDVGEIGWSSMYWMDLTQDRDQWRALVNKVIKFRVP
jgi:hypothetical protein